MPALFENVIFPDDQVQDGLGAVLFTPVLAAQGLQPHNEDSFGAQILGVSIQGYFEPADGHMVQRFAEEDHIKSALGDVIHKVGLNELIASGTPALFTALPRLVERRPGDIYADICLVRMT